MLKRLRAWTRAKLPSLRESRSVLWAVIESTVEGAIALAFIAGLPVAALFFAGWDPTRYINHHSGIWLAWALAATIALFLEISKSRGLEDAVQQLEEARRAGRE